MLARAGAVPSCPSHVARDRRPWQCPRLWDAGSLGPSVPAVCFSPATQVGASHSTPVTCSPVCTPPALQHHVALAHGLARSPHSGGGTVTYVQGPRPARCREVTAAVARAGARSPFLSAPHAHRVLLGRIQDTGPLPGSGAVQASHLKSSLGSEGCPTPTTLLAAILNSYNEPSVKSSTCSDSIYINTQNMSHGTVPWGRGVRVTE